MAKYFVEYGALQANAQRLIECDTSSCPAVKISENFAKRIAYALNKCEPDAEVMCPSETDLDMLEEHAKYMQNHSIYGGGILMSMIKDYRWLRKKIDAYHSVERLADGTPVQNPLAD